MNVTFLLDSGATSHIVSDESLLSSMHESNGEVYFGNNSFETVSGRGTINGSIETSIGVIQISLEDVLAVPNAKYNILSIPKAIEKGISFNFINKKEVLLKQNDVVFAITLKQHRLPCIDIEVKQIKEEVQATFIKDYGELHRSLGHPSEDKAMTYAKNYDCLKYIKVPKDFTCTECIAGKLTRKKPKFTNTKYPLGELIHADLVGPFNPEGLTGARYVLNMIEETSKALRTAFLSSKETTTVQRELYSFIKWINSCSGNTVKRLRTDQGTEFTSLSVKEMCDNLGITQEFTAGYSPEQNGTIERLNRTLIVRVRTMFLDSNLPDTLWDDIYNAAQYLYNYLPHSMLNNKTPFEVLHVEKSYRPPKPNFFKPIGCLAYSLCTKQKRKIDAPGVQKYLVGYSTRSNCYRLWDPDTNLVTPSAQVTFITDRKYSSDSSYSSTIFENMFPASCKDKPQLVERILDEKTTRRGTRYLCKWLSQDKSSKNSWETKERIQNEQAFIDWEHRDLANNCLCDTEDLDDPPNADLALRGPHGSDWKLAMQKEIDHLRDAGTWIVVPRPHKTNVISSRWVLRKKHSATNDCVFKARFVARGFSQIRGIDYDESFAPTVSRASLRIVLVLATARGMKIHQMDATNAFINSDIDRCVYIEQPSHFIEVNTTSSSHVLKLERALYGLCQSPFLWNKLLTETLTSGGFLQCHFDPCVFHRSCLQGENCLIFLIIYVDDIVICSDNDSGINYTKTLLNSKFLMKDLGLANNIIGMEIKRTRDGIVIHQSSYIKKILQDFSIDSSSIFKTPRAENESVLSLQKDEPKHSNQSFYRSMIGSILYTAVCCRPDIAYATGVCSRFVSSPSLRHGNEATRILKYLNGTSNFGLSAKFTHGKIQVSAYTDADWGGDKSDCKSTSGCIIFINQTPVVWRSSKQNCTATSTVESELIAASVACKEAIWVKRLVEELIPNLNLGPIVMNMDNMGSVAISEKQMLSKYTKHIAIKHYFIRECVNENLVIPQYIKTNDNIADVLTKALGRVKFVNNRQSMNLRQI